MSIIDNLNTLENNLVDLRTLLVANLKRKGVGGASASNTLTQLANMVLDITGGEAVTYDLDLTFDSLDNTGKVTFQLNGQQIESTSVNYQANLVDLGIDELTSFSFANTTLKTINAFPDTSKVTSLNSKFSNSLIENLDITNWNLDSVTDVAFAFSYMQNVKSIAYDMTKFSQFENVQGLFGGNSNMMYGNFSPSVATKNMSYMFYGCNKITTIRLEPIDNAEYRPTNVSNMFNGCSRLTQRIDLLKMNWSDITDASHMFNGCSQMQIPLVASSKGPSSKLTNTSYMFANTSFNVLDMNKPLNNNNWEGWFGNCRISNASGMFMNANINGYYDDNVLDVLSWATTDMSSMFEGCSNMTQFTTPASLQSVANCSRMFAGCSNLQIVSFENFAATNEVNASGMFEGCNSLNTIRLWDNASCNAYNAIVAALDEAGLTSQVTIEGAPSCGGGGSEAMVLKLKEYTGADGSIGDSGFNADYDNGSVFVTTLSQLGESSSFSRMTVPSNATHIISLPSSDSLTFLDINCQDLEYCNLSSTNLSNVDTFSLGNCWNLKYLDLSNWQNRNLYSSPFFSSDMTNLKAIKMLNCSDDVKSYIQNELSNEGLNDVLIITEDNNNYVVVEPNPDNNSTIIKVNNNEIINDSNGNWIFDINDVYGSLDGQSVNDMFNNSTHITVYTTPSLSATSGHWSMFANCNSMKGIDLSTWDINFVDNDQDINSMFGSCTSLEWVNLSNWDLTNAYSESSMFDSCNNLQYVIAYNCNDDTISKIESAIGDKNITLYKTQS